MSNIIQLDSRRKPKKAEPFDKAVTEMWSSYFGFLAFGTLLLWEMVRP